MGINARDSWWIEMMEMREIRKSIMYLMEVNNCLFWCLEGCPQITQITCRLEGLCGPLFYVYVSQQGDTDSDHKDNLGPLGLGSLGTLSAVSDFRLHSHLCQGIMECPVNVANTPSILVGLWKHECCSTA